MQTDASETGLGVVLSQELDREDHILRKLTPAEQIYAAVEREALAIKWAIKELHYYLAGRHFTAVTNHAPLLWMAKVKNTNVRERQSGAEMSGKHSRELGYAEKGR